MMTYAKKTRVLVRSLRGLDFDSKPAVDFRPEGEGSHQPKNNQASLVDTPAAQ
jgi:hypothetical protein